MKGTWQTTSGGGSSGIGQVALVAVAAVVALALIGPVVAAVVSLVKVLFIAVVAVALMAASIGGLVLWLRPSAPARAARQDGAGTARRDAHAIPAPQRQEMPAIENHYHFHGVTAEDVAEAIARRQEQS